MAKIKVENPIKTFNLKLIDIVQPRVDSKGDPYLLVSLFDNRKFQGRGYITVGKTTIKGNFESIEDNK